MKTKKVRLVAYVDGRLASETTVHLPASKVEDALFAAFVQVEDDAVSPSRDKASTRKSRRR